jgi:hypothetical protein
MALPTENNVGRTQAANSLERHFVKRFGEDFKTRNKSTENCAQFARACPLAIDSVVD